MKKMQVGGKIHFGKYAQKGGNAQCTLPHAEAISNFQDAKAASPLFVENKIPIPMQKP